MQRPYVIIDEHTLGFIIGNSIQVLRASVIRGGSHVGDTTFIPVNMNGFRPATLKDFQDYMVQPPPNFVESTVAELEQEIQDYLARLKASAAA